ncbi:MAG: DNA glycosylase [Halobacteria archaeon]
MEIPLPGPLDLDGTLTSGQAFRWRKEDGWWRGVVGPHRLALRAAGGRLEVESSGPPDLAARYLRLDDDLVAVHRTLEADPKLRPLLPAHRGLRLLRQEPWECAASFICSAWKSIPAIQRAVEALCERFGQVSDDRIRGFPTPESIARASPAALRACGLGYRARLLREAARQVAEGFSLDLAPLPTEEGRKKIQELCGVGRKVGDCILLFSMDHLEVFPVDVWAARALAEFYGDLLPRKVRRAAAEGEITGPVYRALSGFAMERFGPNAGYAQQVLYVEVRKRNR